MTWKPVIDIANLPRNKWFLLRGRNAVGNPMVPVVCAWHWGKSSENYTWRDSASLRDVSHILSDIPDGFTADWAPLEWE